MDDIARHTETLHNVRLGVRYHMRRQAFFEAWHRATGVVSLLAGSSAVVAVTGNLPLLTGVMAALVALAQAIDLMVDTRKYANLHNDLRRRYLEIEPELLDCQALTESEYRSVWGRIKTIEADEPPIRPYVADLCHNDVLHVAGYSTDEAIFARTHWLKRLFAHFR